MKFGVRLPVAGPFATREGMTQMATEAERLEYDILFSHDNLLWEPGEQAPFYTGSIEAQERRDGGVALYGAIPALAYVIGITKRIQLVPDALCLGWRNVVILAKEAATLYDLSGGRFVLNTCLGRGQHGDYVVTDSSWHERGRVVTEKLQFLRMFIDKDGPISLEGKYLNLSNIEMHPRPKGMQLWHSGGSDAVIKRTARYCEGWMGRSGNMDEKLKALYQEAARVGRGHVRFEVAAGATACIARTDEEALKICRATYKVKRQEPPRPGDLRVEKGPEPVESQIGRSCVGSPAIVARYLQSYRNSGVTCFRLGFIGHTLESILEQMEMFAKEVRPLVG